MSVLAALCTASTDPQRLATTVAIAALSSSFPTVRAKRPKPTIMMIVAAAAGTESFRIDPVSAGDKLARRIGR